VNACGPAAAVPAKAQDDVQLAAAFSSSTQGPSFRPASTAASKSRADQSSSSPAARRHRYEPISGEERFRLTGVLASLLIGATAGGLLVMHAPIFAPMFPFVITAIVVALALKAFGHREDRRVLPNPERKDRA